MFSEDWVTSRQAGYYGQITDDTDILITHSPTFDILDLDDGIDGESIHYVSEEILERVIAIHTRAHLFGHIHHRLGVTEQNGIIFSNGAIMNDDYTKLNTPNIIEL